ncbi:MAG: hypothetical protein ACI82F_001677 [Planctomycetota bacterium]|jgi:hypothetical protein
MIPPALIALQETASLPIPSEDVTSGLSESLRLLDLPAPWIVVLIVLPLFALVTWFGYGRETISTPMRVVLSGLRLSAFLLLFLVLARPVLVASREQVHPATVAVLFDDSASMDRRDAYAGDGDVRAALGAATGLDPTTTSRADLARAAVEKELLPLLKDNGYQTQLYLFAERALPVTQLAQAEARGAGTHLGDALVQALSAQRERHVTDVVIVSDGRSNGGLVPLEAARIAGAQGVSVHTVVVGDTRPERNVIVELVEAPSDALEGDELATTVRILGRGTNDLSSVMVVLEEVANDSDESGRVVAEEEVQLSPDGERLVLVAPAGRANLRTGARRFRVSVTPLDGETMIDDNRVGFTVQVSPARMRVLYVDGYPRWEYRYLKNLLKRADEHIDVQCFLLSATRDFPQESSRGMAPLTAVPTTREELLENYDVVILGDVNPHEISSDPARVEQFMSALREFVEAGGGVLFQAGEWDNPRSFAQTPLEELLPVVLDPTGVLAYEGDTSREFRPLMEDPSNPHEILRLDADVENNRRLWEDPEGLRGFFWYSPVRRAKPGAQVLLRHPSDRNPATNDPYPLLVVGYFPQGRTMFLGVDSTWMWRYHYGDRYHEVFWRNAIRWLALGRLKGGDRRFHLETARSRYDLEERIVLDARVLDEDYRPSEETTQTVQWSGPDGRESELQLVRAEDRPGIYRGGFDADRPGLYRAWIEADGKRASSIEFEVRLPSRELTDPSPDPEAMALVAQKTGGLAVSLANLNTLLPGFGGGEERREPISSRLQDAWDHWATLLLALGLLSTEWILRKRAELL